MVDFVCDLTWPLWAGLIKQQETTLVLFRLLPPASLLVGHDGLNAIVMGGFE